MAYHVAFLRGINVGGRRTLAMADLRRVVSDLGYGHVATFLQSGNLLFDAEAPEAELRRTLEAAIAASFGERLPVTVRTAAALHAVVAECPFAAGPGEAVHAGLLVDPPPPDQRAKLAERVAGSDDPVHLASGTVYVLYRHGMTGSSLSSAFFERHLGVAVTFRNMTTLRRLDNLACR